MRRSLIHFWRHHLAVALGAAVTTAVLSGALIVGDSLRGSLRDLTLDRLGAIDWALVGERPFRPTLAADVGDLLGTAPPASVLTLRASATVAASGARASKVALWGVDEAFFELFPGPPALDLATRSGPFASVALNQALAAELGVAEGAEIVLSFERPSDVPRETVIGREETADTVELLRATVANVLPNRGPGGFGLEPRQTRALNVFIDQGRLARAVFGRGGEGVNLLLGSAPTAGAEALTAGLPSVLTLQDLGLNLSYRGRLGTVESREFVLDDRRASAIEEVARSVGASTQPVLTYLANSLEGNGRSVPYSTISALEPSADPALGPWDLVGGGAVPHLTEDEVILNRWAADDLGVEVGDTIEMTYYTLGPQDELSTTRESLHLAGVAQMRGLAVDSGLTPEFPGIEGADDISAWDPPFPVDLDAIRPRDEEYWDQYRSAPKAFVSLALGQRLWRSRFGSLTSVRIAFPDESAIAAFESGLVAALDPRSAGLMARSLRQEGLRAASGATDFAGLFLGLSLFLIVAAALLAGLLFRLGVEHRASEIGLLRATGFPASRVRRRLLAEGLTVAALGSVAGLAGGTLYAWGLLAGLRTWWLPAIGEPVLFLHIEPWTLVGGAVASLLVVAGAIAGALRRLGRAPIVGLLRGAVTVVSEHRSRRPLVLGIVSLGGAVALGLAMLKVDARTAAGLAFGVGALLLVSGLALFAHSSGRRSKSPNRVTSGGSLALAIRNSARNRARSLLCVTLMAAASFVLVVVAANRLHGEIDVTDRASGAGGFTLVAETDVPLYGELASHSPTTAAALSGREVLPFRLLPGEDVSCLNLYQPERPRILGAPAELASRGGFTFQQTASPTDNGWELLNQTLEDGVIPAIGDYNSVLWILHSGLGQDIELENERGETIRLRLVGLLSKSLFQSELVISAAAFERHFPSTTGYSYFLVGASAGDRPAETATLAANLESELGRFGFDAVSTAERLAAFQAVENTYLSTFQTLGGLGLLLGTLGMGIVLLRNVLERQAELATLRAIGYRRARLRTLVLFENAFLLAIGLAIGTAAGAAAAAPHLLIVGQALPWADLGLVLLAVFATGMASSVLAVRNVARLPLVPSLRSR